MSEEQFQKEADTVLNFLQDKLEEYVEDNDIPGGDVEQGVRIIQHTCIIWSKMAAQYACNPHSLIRPHNMIHL